MIRRRTKKRRDVLEPNGGGLPENIANIVKRELVTNTSFWEHISNISHTTALLSRYKSLQNSIANVKSSLGTNPKDHCLEEGIIVEYNNIIRSIVDLAKYAPDKYKLIMRHVAQEIVGSNEVHSNKHIIEQLSKKEVRNKLQVLLSTFEQLSPYLEGDSKNMFLGLCELGKNILKDPVLNYSENLLIQSKLPGTMNHTDLRDVDPWKSVNSAVRNKTMKRRNRFVL
jgi:hypothetical protein